MIVLSPFHREVSCVPFVQKGSIIKCNPVVTKKVLAKFEALSQQRGNRDGGGRAKGRHATNNPDPSPSANQPAEDVAEGTSIKKVYSYSATIASDTVPPVPATASTNNQFASLVDKEELSSNSNDNADELEAAWAFRNWVEDSGKQVPGSSTTHRSCNTNTATSYLPSTPFCLPFGGPIIHPVCHKRIQKLANSAACRYLASTC